MKKTKNWQGLRYEIFDLIAGDLLDEAYEHGIKTGAEYATRTISFRVGLKGESKELTKTQKLGYDQANEVIQSCKEDIRKTTGALV